MKIGEGLSTLLLACFNILLIEISDGIREVLLG